ncbi:MAG: DUF4397 domain-containing protein [Bacteroidota bacterium]
MKIKAIITALAVTITLSSCMKDDDFTPQPVSGLSIIHAIPGTEKLDFYVDNNKANSSFDLSYTDKIDYLNLFPGKRQFSVTRKGVQTQLKSESHTLDPNSGYSAFIGGSLESLSLLVLKDDLTAPATGKARIRFVNLSPDAPALNLAVAGKETDIFTNKLFKEYSNFESIDAAEKVTFTLKNKETGATEATLADVKIDAGRIYTIWVKGLKAATDDTKIGLAVYQHK